MIPRQAGASGLAWPTLAPMLAVHGIACDRE
jgi:hypothetical protein